MSKKTSPTLSIALFITSLLGLICTFISFASSYFYLAEIHPQNPIRNLIEDSCWRANLLTLYGHPIIGWIGVYFAFFTIVSCVGIIYQNLFSKFAILLLQLTSIVAFAWIYLLFAAHLNQQCTYLPWLGILLCLLIMPIIIYFLSRTYGALQLRPLISLQAAYKEILQINYFWVSGIVVLSLGFGLKAIPIIMQQIIKNHQDAAIPFYVQEWKTAPLRQISVIDGTSVNRDYSKGPANAPVRIVAFTDFSCPACRKIYPFFETLLEKYPGKILFVLKDFPNTERCPLSVEASDSIPFGRCLPAMIARCAGEQGKFWEMANAINHMNWEGTEDEVATKLNNLLPNINLDLEKLSSCISSGKQVPIIQEKIDDARKIGANVTPTIYINERLVGTNYKGTLEAIVAELLQNRH